MVIPEGDLSVGHRHSLTPPPDLPQVGGQGAEIPAVNRAVIIPMFPPQVAPPTFPSVEHNTNHFQVQGYVNQAASFPENIIVQVLQPTCCSP